MRLYISGGDASSIRLLTAEVDYINPIDLCNRLNNVSGFLHIRASLYGTANGLHIECKKYLSRRTHTKDGTALETNNSTSNQKQQSKHF
jgi:hypothetical protein